MCCLLWKHIYGTFSYHLLCHCAFCVPCRNMYTFSKTRAGFHNHFIRLIGLIQNISFKIITHIADKWTRDAKRRIYTFLRLKLQIFIYIYTYQFCVKELCCELFEIWSAFIMLSTGSKYLIIEIRRTVWDLLTTLVLKGKANVNSKDGNGRTALHVAVSQSHKRMVEILLTFGKLRYSRPCL